MLAAQCVLPRSFSVEAAAEEDQGEGLELDLMQRAMNDEDYFDLERRVCGQGAYPLGGAARVTREIHDTPLFRAAEDIVSVTEAAAALGITRSAVIKAAQAGRIKGKKIGHTWALLRRSVASYRVAQHRVEAGRAAHQ